MQITLKEPTNTGESGCFFMQHAFTNRSSCFIDNITSNTKDNLQKAANKLNQIITEYDLIISAQRSKSMAFTGRYPITSKIVIDNKFIEQIKCSNY
jgi:hypothetical protein